MGSRDNFEISFEFTASGIALVTGRTDGEFAWSSSRDIFVPLIRSPSSITEFKPLHASAMLGAKRPGLGAVRYALCDPLSKSRPSNLKNLEIAGLG
jgi:hypothetical protein